MVIIARGCKWNNDNWAIVQIDFGIFLEKVPTIVGHENVVAFPGIESQAPIRPSAAPSGQARRGFPVNPIRL
jgi:hypothetical protein